jgi:hypothetical protein
LTGGSDGVEERGAIRFPDVFGEVHLISMETATSKISSNRKIDIDLLNELINDERVHKMAPMNFEEIFLHGSGIRLRVVTNVEEFVPQQPLPNPWNSYGVNR